jgi:hypothetical protein
MPIVAISAALQASVAISADSMAKIRSRFVLKDVPFLDGNAR